MEERPAGDGVLRMLVREAGAEGSWGPAKCCAGNMAGAVAGRSSLTSRCPLPSSSLLPSVGTEASPPPSGPSRHRFCRPSDFTDIPARSSQTRPPVQFSCCSLSHTASGRGSCPEGVLLGQWQRTRDSQEGQVDMVPVILPAGIPGLQIPCWGGGRGVYSDPRALISFLGVR